MSALNQLCKQTIWKLKRQPPIANSGAKNQWKEFCWHFQGDSTEISLWEDAILGYISLNIGSLRRVDRIEALSIYDNDPDELCDAVLSLIKLAARDYLFENDW